MAETDGKPKKMPAHEALLMQITSLKESYENRKSESGIDVGWILQSISVPLCVTLSAIEIPEHARAEVRRRIAALHPATHGFWSTETSDRLIKLFDELADLPKVP